ncbi:DUF3093 domain-containing protein [Rhodococcus spelaei]|uniref:DUF3093 domain-containing protein n=1 Tax=Rhodococcus spelaei TaxID=2546320 RepID=UPI001FE74316|nr:DUF3093 domain-containing protein [Rhodococcus spelaei]
MSENPQPASLRTDRVAAAPSYSERLWVPLWWWAAGFVVAVLIAVEVNMGVRSLIKWLPFVLLLPFPVWALVWLSRVRVEVFAGVGGAPGELRAGRAHLPLDAISRVAIVPGTAKSAALGRQLDPAAYVEHRTWIKPMVLIVLDDPDDPTPYWLVSTRRPTELAAALGKK